MLTVRPGYIRSTDSEAHYIAERSKIVTLGAVQHGSVGEIKYDSLLGIFTNLDAIRFRGNKVIL